MARTHAPGATHRWPSRRAGLRALAIEITCGFVLLVLAACTLFGSGLTTVSVLNTDAPVPSGSGLYSLRFAQENSGSYSTIVRDDAVTGEPQWQQDFPGSSPTIAVSGGVLYVVNGLDVLALRGSDGTRIWDTTLSASGQTQANSIGPVGGQPVVADNHVYLSMEDSPGNLQHVQIVALRASDGAHLWSRAFDGVQGIAAGDGLVVVSTGGNGVIALHAADGSVAWQAQSQAQYVGRAQVLGGLVYVDEEPGPLVALDERTGALVWTLPCWEQTGIAPSASGAQIYIGCLEPHNALATAGGIFAFDTQQRQLLWKRLGADFITTPIAVGNLVFIPNGTALDAVRASDGKRVWSRQAEEPNAGPVALARIGDTLYVRMSVKYPHIYIFGCGTTCKQSYSLSALRPSDGAPYWRRYEPNGTMWRLAA